MTEDEQRRLRAVEEAVARHDERWRTLFKMVGELTSDVHHLREAIDEHNSHAGKRIAQYEARLAYLEKGNGRRNLVDRSVWAGLGIAAVSGLWWLIAQLAV